jgi:hypothetical protein
LTDGCFLHSDTKDLKAGNELKVSDIPRRNAIVQLKRGDSDQQVGERDANPARCILSADMSCS